MTTLLLCGPSGSGKSTLTRFLTAHYDFQKIVTVTTRPMRDGELEGDHYYFRSEADYQELLEDGQFFMSNTFFGSRYGTLKSEVDRIIEAGNYPVMETYIPTVAQYKEIFPDTLAVYLLPSNPEVLPERMRKRGDSETAIAKRMERVAEELAYYEEHKGRLIDFSIEVGAKTVEELAAELFNRTEKFQLD